MPAVFQLVRRVTLISERVLMSYEVNVAPHFERVAYYYYKSFSHLHFIGALY